MDGCDNIRLILNCSSSPENERETVNTLKFGERVLRDNRKSIKGSK